MPDPLKSVDGEPAKIVVVGLGYGGLPLAVALAGSHPEARVVAKLQYDFYYVKYLSAWLDILITFRTTITGFGCR